MQIRKPSHTTVVAYLALFAALGGTAIAARNDTGAKELKHLVVRHAERVVGPQEANEFYSVVVRCRRREQFISGSGSWETIVGDGTPLSSVISTSVLKERANGPAFGYRVIGTNRPGLPNALIAEALCLPK